jgi:outer membrane protein OmpA-like peptidoglycan-associated protein
MIRNHRIRLECALLLLGLVAASGARAQDPGFALDRFDPAERGSDWFVGESLDLRGASRPALGLTLDWSHKPLVLYGANGGESAVIVKDQLFAHVGGSIVLGQRVRVGVNLPLLLAQDGQDATVGGVRFAPEHSFSVGDLRVGADLRLLGSYGDAATLAIGLQAHLPTGNTDAFASDGKVRLAPRVMLAGDVALFAYSARVSFGYRDPDQIADDVATGSELGFAATAGVRVLDKRLLVGPELWGSTVLDDGAAFEKQSTPFELLFSAHCRVPDWLFGLGVGPGLTRGLGSPALRLLASVDWQPDVPEPRRAPAPPPPPPDRDGDGVVDAQDACPFVAGAASSDPHRNGCPPDRDGDGVVDAEDACPDVPGARSDDAGKNGCPPDRDGDGVIDAEDACPGVPGVRSDDASKNGCPSDRDGDGILDADDACPDAAGPRSNDPHKNGCPAARIEENQIKILERVEFKTGSAQLLPESAPILEAVRAVLEEHTEIAEVSIEGHTDNVGKPASNQALSERRAASVRAWLAAHGVDRKRLSAAGFGATRPIDTNDTDAGREHNRRVEFHIEGAGGQEDR